MGSLNPAQSGVSNFISSQLPNNQSAENVYSQSGQSGTENNLYTGDSISFTTKPKTADSGTQNAQTAHIGDETLTKFGNGAAAVSNKGDANIVSLENGKLYDRQAGQTKKTDLGAWSNASAQDAAVKALGGGVGGLQKYQDLSNAGGANGNLGSAETVKEHEHQFGVEGQAGFNALTTQLEMSSQAQQAQNPAQHSDLLTSAGKNGQLAAASENGISQTSGAQIQNQGRSDAQTGQLATQTNQGQSGLQTAYPTSVPDIQATGYGN